MSEISRFYGIIITMYFQTTTHLIFMLGTMNFALLLTSPLAK